MPFNTITTAILHVRKRFFLKLKFIKQKRPSCSRSQPLKQLLKIASIILDLQRTREMKNYNIGFYCRLSSVRFEIFT